ncbi:MAG: DUF1428 domain-containing protein [Beijerinckiaceae bacterium]
MAYIDGYVIPVPNGNKEAYRKMAEAAAPVFRKHGALRVVECWGDDVPEGKTTDFRRAVKAEDGEQVVFSWIVWPSKSVRDEAMPKAMEDPVFKAMKDMPFDGKRMIFGGFDVLLDSGRD